MIRPRTKLLLAAGAALALSIPVLAQDQPESLLPPGFGDPAPAPAATPTPSTTPSTAPPATQPRPDTSLIGLLPDASIEDLTEADIPPPIELPDHARRDPSLAGPLGSGETGFARGAWGRASGKFLSVLMRKTDTPLASRWGHILLRGALLTDIPAPSDVHPADWVAERAWLLLRMGEADGARLLISEVDVDDFTPKLFQVAVQSALANSDPSGLCPLEGGIERHERNIYPLVKAMCASLSGSSEIAAADIDSARRRGRIGGIDLGLADKVVGAGADSGRSATIEWEPVQHLTAWRFGLSTATGMVPPQRLLEGSRPQVVAWMARTPILSAQQRLAAARVAAGLGVFSSQALMDLYSIVYESTDTSDLGQTDAWQVRLAFAGKDLNARLDAMRRLWSAETGSLEKEATRALLGRAASRIAPDPELEADAPEIIASMLAAGMDREAARWAGAVRQLDDDDYADRSWAMLALGAPTTNGIDLGFGRINAFVDRDTSPGKQRGALLVAGLAGLGRIDARTAGRLNDRYGLGLAQENSWTRTIDAASGRRQAATVAVLTGVGFQAAAFGKIPASHMFHAVTALSRNGQGFYARMIAAEALSRT